jgi:hypothetical protein
MTCLNKSVNLMWSSPKIDGEDYDNKWLAEVSFLVKKNKGKKIILFLLAY